MKLSSRQNIFAKYLLRRIGYNNETLIEYYIYKLEKIFGKVRKEYRTITNNGYSREVYDFKFDGSDCIKELLDETNLKKNLGSIKIKTSFNNQITATDLSNFQFCPISYSINKSFEIEYPTNENKRLTGLKLHESLRLIKGTHPGIDESQLYTHKVIENNIIKKIKNCKVIYIGHSDGGYFINKKLKYFGQPDYIFQDPNDKYFVVEEKFIYMNSYFENEKSKFKKYFHKNHIVQTKSYIDYIVDYKIDYGILIYWFYDFSNHEIYPTIHDVSHKVIGIEYSELLENTYKDLSKFILDKKIEVTHRVNLNKCLTCVVSKYCGHKTMKYDSLEMPYNRYLLKLQDIEFPQILRKTEDDNNENYHY